MDKTVLVVVNKSPDNKLSQDAVARMKMYQALGYKIEVKELGNPEIQGVKADRIIFDDLGNKGE